MTARSYPERTAPDAYLPDISPAGKLDFPDDDWAHRFFEAYTGPIGLCNRAASARHAGIHVRSVVRRIEADEVFADLVAQAEAALTEAVEQVMMERILHGTERPVFQHGAIVGYVREVDNSLLRFWLERRVPEKYHIATRVEHVNPDTPGAWRFELGDKPSTIELGPGEYTEDE
jgi:hypothetical protein